MQAAVEWRNDMYAKCDSRIGKLTEDPDYGYVELQWLDDGTSDWIETITLIRLTAAEMQVPWSNTSATNEILWRVFDQIRL